jgi:hypothetical protein
MWSITVQREGEANRVKRIENMELEWRIGNREKNSKIKYHRSRTQIKNQGFLTFFKIDFLDSRSAPVLYLILD